MSNQQSMAVCAISNKLFKAASKGEGIPDGLLNRLKDLTLSESDVKKVMAQMKKHGVVDENSRTGVAKNLHVDMWDDQELWQKYKIAMNQYTAQVIQRNLVGESHWYMGTTLGKVLTQFRKFPIVALEKQMLHDLKFKDKEAMATFAYGLAFSTAAYYAKVNLNSVGRPDAEEYREKLLTGERLFSGSIGYMGQLAYIPDTTKIVLGTLTGDHRASSRAGTRLFPMAGLPEKVAKAGIGARKVLLPDMLGIDNDASFQDVQNMAGITGINNIMFLRNFFNVMGTIAEEN
jgi:hypothetical protein